MTAAAIGRIGRRLAPFAGLAVLILGWDLALRLHPGSLLPLPAAVLGAIGELAGNGLLLRHVVASLFRVTWGYLARGRAGGAGRHRARSYRRPEQAVAPLLEILRPISPLAWIPIAILWLGVGDLAAVAIIFLASSCR